MLVSKKLLATLIRKRKVKIQIIKYSRQIFENENKLYEKKEDVFERGLASLADPNNRREDESQSDVPSLYLRAGRRERYFKYPFLPHDAGSNNRVNNVSINLCKGIHQGWVRFDWICKLQEPNSQCLVKNPKF